MTLGLADITAQAQERLTAGDPAGARDLLGPALADAAPGRGHPAPELAEATALHARILVALGEVSAARAWAAYAYSAATRLYGSDDERSLAAGALLAAVLHRVGSLARAARLYRGLIAELTAVDGPESPRVLPAQADLATVEHARGECAVARDRLREAWELHREVYGDGHPSGIRMLARLGVMERDCGLAAEAHDHLILADELCRLHLDPDHPLAAQVAELAAADADPSHACGDRRGGTEPHSSGTGPAAGHPPPEVDAENSRVLSPDWPAPEGRGAEDRRAPDPGTDQPDPGTDQRDPGTDQPDPGTDQPDPVSPKDAPGSRPTNGRVPFVPSPRVPYEGPVDDPLFRDPLLDESVLDDPLLKEVFDDNWEPSWPSQPAGDGPSDPPRGGVPPSDRHERSGQPGDGAGRPDGVPGPPGAPGHGDGTRHGTSGDFRRDEWAGGDSPGYAGPDGDATPDFYRFARWPRRDLLPIVIAGLVILLLGTVAVAAGVALVGSTRTGPGRSAGPPAAAGSPSASATKPVASSPATPPATTPRAASPAASPGAPPTGVRIRDTGDSVALTWTYPAGADGPVVISGSRAGLPPRAFQELPPGSSAYVVYGLDPHTDFCFSVGVVYRTDEIGRSGSVCTSRSGAGPG